MSLTRHSHDTGTSHHYRKRQQGVGFIEILVTVLLLSVGFLAAAQMQVQSMRYSQSAYLQSQAYFMISDMMDRMRGNVTGVNDGFYDSLSTSSGAINPDCNSNFCNASQLAAQDLFDWSTNLHPLRGTADFIPLLPSSDSTVARATVSVQANGLFEVSVFWSEKIGNANVEQSLSLEFAP